MSLDTAAEIRRRRPARPEVDPWRPLGTVVETERRVGGQSPRRVLTVFLAGAECPFTCAFCDLWRHTLDGPTPSGALPAQLERGLAAHADVLDADWAVKLYNASNFFDPRAVPSEDLPAIAALVARFARVTVECHPRLVDDRAVQLARLLSGRLELAMGLETVHPTALARIGKGMTLEDFDRAARFAVRQGMAVRAFVLVGVPWVPPAETIEWTVRTAKHAAAAGAERIALIAVRPGNGTLELLARHGAWRAPVLSDLEAALEGCLGLGATVEADLWELEALAHCSSCRPSRLERLRRLNESGRLEPSCTCSECGVG